MLDDIKRCPVCLTKRKPQVLFEEGFKMTFTRVNALPEDYSDLEVININQKLTFYHTFLHAPK